VAQPPGARKGAGCLPKLRRSAGRPSSDTGESVVVYDKALQQTHGLVDTDGDGIALGSIDLSGKHLADITFIL